MFLPIMLLLASVAMSTPTALSTTTNPQGPKVETLGQYVKQYYADTPILADIAWCESRIRHVDKEGDILRGVVNPKDIGVMQINTKYHEEQAEAMNLDLHTLDGNLAYAKRLYEKEGTKPWASSKACWGPLSKKSTEGATLAQK
ncbi:MAG: hypothetical protein WC880_02050 [Candidatus Paceibacterota bacterium]